MFIFRFGKKTWLYLTTGHKSNMYKWDFVFSDCIGNIRIAKQDTQTLLLDLP